MNDTISRQAGKMAKEEAKDFLFNMFNLIGTTAVEYWTEKDAEKMRQAVLTIDTVLVVRCKDCKHRPTGTDRDDLEFPDDKCPCKCEDYWYSWKPSDDWFCGNGE